MAIRVALDLSHVRQTGAGTARTARSLEAALAARDDVDVVTLGAGAVTRRGSARQRVLALEQDLVWHPLLGRRAAHRAGAEVYHCLVPRAPLRAGRPPLLVSIHDLAVYREPATLSRWNRLYTTHTLPRIAAAADLLVAVSADTARDLERLLGISPERIRVVPNGVDGRFFGAASARPPVEGPFVLFVGTGEPRKNLARLVAATGLLGRRLVTVGAAGWGGADVGDDHVMALGRVDDATLHALYAAASCLCIPSLHEGFGLPAVEAMAVGCPVVAARVGALPEVCGDAAVLVDPLAVDQIAAGIETAIATADELRRRGRERASAFTWERSAALMAEAYRAVASASSSAFSRAR